MKKLLVLTLTVLTITSLVGCGSKNEKVGNEENSSNIIEASENEMLLAKVQKVVGNEISVKVSDDNLGMVEGGEGSITQGSYTLDEGQLTELKDGGVISFDDGTVISNVTIGEGSEGGSVELAESGELELFNGESSNGEVAFVDEITSDDIFSQLEFNGEDKELIIPAGVEIFSKKTGKAGNVSDIKEGSILSIVIDSKTNTVTRIDIMG